MNVGSGGGAAPAAGAAAGGAAPAEAAAEEEKVEGKDTRQSQILDMALTIRQTRRSPMRIWVSVFSIKRIPVLSVCTYLAWPRLLVPRCNIGLVGRTL